MRYLIETGPYTDLTNTNLLIKQDNSDLYRYDPISKDWILDYDLCIIYTDHIEVESITEKEAEKVIQRFNKAYETGTYKARSLSQL